MPSNKKRIWTFSGGKGGVGKSLVSAAVAACLARAGKSVLAVEADLAGSNLHSHFGIESPPVRLLDFLEDRVRGDQVTVQTAQPGLRVLCDAGRILGVASPFTAQKEKLIRFVATVPGDYLVVDLGSGTLSDMLDFFNMSDQGIVAVTPDPTSMQNAYDFIARAFRRRIERQFGSNESVVRVLGTLELGADGSRPTTTMELYEQLYASDPSVADRIAELADMYRPQLLVNLASGPQDRKTADILISACRKFLNVDIRCCGTLRSDPFIGTRGASPNLLELDNESNPFFEQVRGIVRALDGSRSDQLVSHAEEPVLTPEGNPLMGLNDNLLWMGEPVHVQTEDMGCAGRCIATQVFRDGRIILSRKSDYPAEGEDFDRNQVMELMRRQHLTIIREIEEGRIVTGPSRA